MRRMRYEEYLATPGWRQRRQQALRHYRNRCMICGLPGAEEVHHVTYQHLGNERMHELAPMHSTCHSMVTEIRTSVLKGVTA